MGVKDSVYEMEKRVRKLRSKMNQLADTMKLSNAALCELSTAMTEFKELSELATSSASAKRISQIKSTNHALCELSHSMTASIETQFSSKADRKLHRGRRAPLIFRNIEDTLCM